MSGDEAPRSEPPRGPDERGAASVRPADVVRAAQKEAEAEARAQGGQRLPPLDPNKPLRMPGASLRAVQRGPDLGGLVAWLSDAVAARREARGRSDGDASASAGSREVPSPVSASQGEAAERSAGDDAAGPDEATQPVQPSATAGRRSSRRPSGITLAVAGLVVFAAGVLIAVPLQSYYESEPVAATPTETTQAVAPAPGSAVAPGPSPAAASDGGALAAADAAPPPPKVFRVRQLSADSSLDVVEGTVGKRTLVAALSSSGLLVRDAYRVISAFKGKKSFDRPKSTDAFTFAKKKGTNELVAFEYAVPPFDVWQARFEDGVPEVSKVVFTPEPRRVTRAVLVGDDLKKSLVAAELDDDLLAMLDDALDGHAELVDMRPGARLRIVVEEERIEGAFSRYSHLDAVEYYPANPKAKRVRVYRFDPSAEPGRKRAHSFYDEAGRQPYKGGFRSPVPLGRITSRFNPRRLHPVLRVVMPHNGVDFAAPPGTPVYATSSGVVRSAAMAGPNGNMVQVQHPSGLVSAYCHLSRFAAGMRPGAHVESRQLVGYVGTTGRSTGPHLHFAIKRGETFLDPLSLRLDGTKVLPAEHKEAFEKLRSELDPVLDAIGLPDAPASHVAAAAEDIIYDEVPDAAAPDAEAADAAVSP